MQAVRSSSPLPKWLFSFAIAWIVVNFITVIFLQEQLSNLIESTPPTSNAVSYSAEKILSASEKSQGTFKFDRNAAERALQQHGRDEIFQPLRAYIEKPLNDTVPGTIDQGNLNDKRPKIQAGRPAQWYVPLPLRENTPDDVSDPELICILLFI